MQIIKNTPLKIYKASAGSGKTFRLTEEYLLLLFNAKKRKMHRHILAVTFTNKATEEMKSRIMEELFILSTEKDSKHREFLMKETGFSAEAVNLQAGYLLKEIVHDYSSFSISTIDSFFQQVIRSFAREIGMNGGYSLELNNEQILEQSVDNMFFELDDPANKELLTWLTQYAEERILNAQSWNFRYPILELGKEIFKEDFQTKAAEIREKLHDKSFLSSYRKQLHQIRNDYVNQAKKHAQKSLEILDEYGLKTEQFSGGKRSSMNALNKIADGEIHFSQTFRNMAEDVDRSYAKSADQDVISSIKTAYHNGFQENLINLIQHVDENLIRYNTAEIILRHLNTLGILSDIYTQIKKLTSEQNIMLISDSNLLLNKIIDGSDVPLVYEKTAMYLDSFMIDEFQDTSVLQWGNFKPLVGESLSRDGANLVVGDVKQSIYRWRNSDWKLLANQIENDFRAYDILHATLDTNYRSDKNIVDFNNVFFEATSKFLQELLNTNLEEIKEQIPVLEDLESTIVDAYADTKQKVKPGVEEGFVQIQMIDEKNYDVKWEEESLNRLPAILEDLQDRGYKPSDVAILVRTRAQETQVVQKLLQHKSSTEKKEGYSYDIMGTEGLMIESAHAIKFLLGVLRLFIQSDDKVQRLLVNYEYAHNVLKKSESEALSMAVEALRSVEEPDEEEELEEHISPLFSAEENAAIKELKQYSLFEMTEKLISLFDLAAWHKEMPFIQAFQDVVLEFSTRKSSDIHSFIQWWDKYGDKQFIATPENENAYRIMTIHKSKGLAFNVVVMPFCDWDLETSFRTIIWSETDVAPFNELPLIPANYTKSLGQSVFAETYFREMMHAYIDNLNLGYVAFTRPRHELIMLCPYNHPNKKGELNINKFSKLLQEFITKPSNAELFAVIDEEEMHWEIGEPTTQESSKKKAKSFASDIYPVGDLSGRLRLKHSVGLFNRDEVDITETPLDYGNMMHEIFCRMEKRDDHVQIVDSFIRKGRLKLAEAEQITADIEAFWAMSKVDAWFKEGLSVLNETTILTPEGYHYRPDRIILEGNKATVIDYKFGALQRKSYERQVQNYLRLLHEMGYETEGYLCYVKRGEVVPISLWNDSLPCD